MDNYETLKELCLDQSRLSEKVFDNFLLYYAADQDKLGQEFEKNLVRYKHIVRDFQPGWLDYFKTQFIAHRLFKSGGLIHKYLNHSALRFLKDDERKYLEQLASTAWKFSFGIITANPSRDFYQMEDVFSEESYLLYSPGMSDTLRRQQISLWFHLIGYNGSCWQSFGPILSFQSFEPDDIFYFAGELNQEVESEEDVLAEVDQNPVPFMMLIMGSLLPLLYHQNVRVTRVSGIYDCASLDPSVLAKDFMIDYAGVICRLRLKKWDTFPHFAVAYFDPEDKTITLSVMSQEGFQMLRDRLAACGYHFEGHPQVRVGASMLSLASRILKKELELDPYEELFVKEPSGVQNEEVSKLNELIKMMLDDINAGITPDYKALSVKTGLPVTQVRQVAEEIKKTREKYKKR